MKDLSRNLILLLFAVIVAAVLLEAALWIIFPAPGQGSAPIPAELIPAVPSQTSETYHPDLGWFNRPGYRGVLKGPDENESVIAINSRGLREEDVEYEKAPGKKRVVVLGDSFAWGFGLKAEERFSDLLKREFPVTEVINMGVVGYSTDQECVLLEKEGVRYRPDGVLLLVHDTDIFHNALSANYGRAKPHFSLEGSELVLRGIPVTREAIHEGERAGERPTVAGVVKKSLLSRSRLYALISSHLKRIAPLKKLLVRAGLIVPGRSVAADVALTGAIISRMEESAKRAGAADLWVLLVPSQEVISSYAPGSRLRIKEEEVVNREEAVNGLKLWLRERGVAVIDLTPAFIAATREGKSLYFRTDNHWNREANRIASAAVAEAWKKTGYR